MGKKINARFNHSLLNFWLLIQSQKLVNTFVYSTLLNTSIGQNHTAWPVSNYTLMFPPNEQKISIWYFAC